MSDLYVKRQYCEEHSAQGHYCDENYHCHGETLQQIEKRGYCYARHIGGGWYRMTPKYNPALPLEWQMPEDPPEHDIHVIEPDF